MQLKRITLHHLQMELKSPFTTSFGTFKTRDFILVEAVDADGTVGWGESVAFHSPWYNEETFKTNWHMLVDYLIPLVLQELIAHPEAVHERFAPIRKNNMAKSAIEGAIWDLYAKQQGVSLSRALGGEKKQIEVGISIGIQESVKHLLSLIERYVAEGYRRIEARKIHDLCRQHDIPVWCGGMLESGVG